MTLVSTLTSSGQPPRMSKRQYMRNTYDKPAFQLRRYVYTDKLGLSILTDFSKCAVYDARIKPNKSDYASVALMFYCTYKEYPEYVDLRRLH